MTKQRLMLSAAACALLASALAVSLAHADTEISTSQGTAVATAAAGNVTIDTGAGIGISAASPALTINSNNWATNNGGTITNNGIDGAIGVEIDTTAGNLVSPLAASGFNNAGTIDVSGSGTGKAGVLITGGNTFFGPISFSVVTASVTTGSTTSTQIVGGSSVLVQGDSSGAFYLVQGTNIVGDVSIGGSMSMAPSSGSQGSASALVNFDGTLYGNLGFDPTASLTSVGNSARGVQILGGIHSCASDSANFPSGFACPTDSSGNQTSVGAFVNQGTIQVIGVQYPNPKSANPESGSALVIGSSIDGGFENSGPATSILNTAATIAANGVNGAPTLLIDPSQSVFTGTTILRGPVIIGPLTPVIDQIDPGYSMINRGTITATPTDGQVSAAAIAIVGSDATTNFTCLSAVVGSCQLVDPNNATIKGGLLNTGTISAQAFTTQQTNSNGLVSATALYIGQYATVPRIDVSGEPENGSTTTPGTISATVQGQGGGSAAAIVIGQFANVPAINVKAHATITASVSTSTYSPTNAIANSAAPFTLSSEAIVDQSGSLRTINNAGLISALNSQLAPASDAVVALSARAIDLLASTAGGIVINNSGVIRGDVLFGTAGGSDILNVGNVGGAVQGVDANPATCFGSANNCTLNTPNNYAVVAATTGTIVAGSPPLTTTNLISFGSGTGQQLNVGGFGYVNSVILSATGGVDINVYNNGTLFIANTVSALGTVAATGSVNAHDLNVYTGGKLGLTISQGSSGTNPIVAVSDQATIQSGAILGLQFGSFVSSGTTAASVNAPVPQNITLIATPVNQLHIDNATLGQDNESLAQNIPFLFQPTQTPLSVVTTGGRDQLVLTLTPKSPDQLGITGDAKSLFPYAAAALANDPTLGAAIAGGITSNQTAQNVFSQFAPDVSGGARQVAIMMTDQATGPVAARQRLLRSYGNTAGDMTLWGEEFAANINNKGRVDGDGSLTGYKDHGFGFAVGMDGGSARGGWYGGALSFYSGDVIETLPRSSKTNMQWYMLTGYTDWRGKHVFLDTQASVAYGNFTGHRSLFICGGAAVTCETPSVQREADSKRAGLLGALGATTGVMLKWQGVEIVPHIGLDAMSLREEGYTETGGGDGLDLRVEPYYASSIRTALGTDIKGNIDLWGFTLSPEARLGYRYDFINMPVKLRAGFVSTGGTATNGNAFTFVGPDPDSGNLLSGVSLGASTDTWQFGANYDWIHGNNGSTTQIGMLTVLGRI